MGVKKTHVRNISNPDAWAKKEAIEPKCVHDTVIIKHDSIIIRETYREHIEKEQKRVYYVYFDNNKSNLNDKALITIQQVAEILAEDTTLYAVVTGYCDNTGSASLNYALGDKRADNVIGELSAEHAIDTARMYAMGMGKVIGRRSQASYSPNRRAAIRLVDKATFERMKHDLDDTRANRIEEEDKPQVQTVPLSESARPEKVNEYQHRSSEEVTTDKSTTLSRLARKYYNNTYCWVYIYIANKEKISNPNALVPGTTLIIPELTQKEMQITKDESLVLFSNARQQK
jgi:outer membrane protein OmpA-like peptidoglycan-associated protein